MDIPMDIHGYIHGYPQNISGYGYEYGWQISYPRQAWRMTNLFHKMYLYSKTK